MNGSQVSTGEERLLLTYSALALIGSTLNVLLLTSLALLHSEPSCRPIGGGTATSCKGNGLLVASQCLVHMAVTCLDLPFRAVCILAGLPFECGGTWLLSEWRDRGGAAAGMASAVHFLALGVEHLGRSDARRDDSLSLGGAAVMALASWTYGGFLSVWFLKARPTSSEWCLRSPPLLVPLAMTVPCALALVAFLLAGWRSSRGQNPRKRERTLLRSDAAAFATFLCFWSPFTVASALEAQDQLPQLLEVGRSFAVACPLVYGAWHEDLRCLYSRLARYCCCKANAGLLPSPDSSGGRPRARLAADSSSASGSSPSSGMERRPRTALLLPVAARGPRTPRVGREDHYL